MENSRNIKLKPQIVCTTGMISDGVQAIVGEKMEVITLMRPGIDPHLYRPTPSTLKAIDQADVIVHNGLHLEGNLVKVFERLTNFKQIFAISEGIDPENYLRLGDWNQNFDPHIWMHIPLWLQGLEGFLHFISTFDPSHRDFYHQNFVIYQKKLIDLHQENQTKLNMIPESQRILITTHDAFAYFSKAYQIPVQALQGISTQSDFGVKKVQNLIQFILKNNIKAIFVESTVPQKAFHNIQEACQKEGHFLKIAGPLYTDALGVEEANTYYEMLKFNTDLIVQALQ